MRIKHQSDKVDAILAVFKGYINKTIDLYELKAYLSEIENQIRITYKYPTNKSLWVRFFTNDSAATTIQDIYRDLSGNTNKNYMLENFYLALENKSNLQVYFS